MIGDNKKQSHENRIDLAGEYKWGDIGQIIFLIVFIIGMISDFFLLRISGSWEYLISWYFRFIVFIIIIFIAGYFSQRAHRKVFKERRQKLIVIKTDVYAIIRHPMYFGSILLYLGFVILSFSLIALLVFIIIIIFYYYLCCFEERILIEKLGDEYKNYMKKVPMLIPRFRI